MPFFFILLFLAFAAYGQQFTVAVLPSDSDVLSNDELEALTDKMRESVLKTLSDDFILLKQDVVIKRLGGAENYIKECKESSCIVDLGKKAQVDYVSQASVGKLGDKLRLKIELYNVKTGGLLGIYNEHFDNFLSLFDAVDKHIPDVFKKITSTPETQKPTPPPVATTPPPEPKEVPPIEPVTPVVEMSDEEYLGTLAKVQELIANGVEKNKEEIQKKSFYLAPINRERFYKENMKTGAGNWAVFNVLPGFGLGSYIQGDKFSRVILSIGDGVGVLLFIIAGGIGSYNIITDAMCISSYVVLVSGRIAGLIVPFYHQYSYNKELRERLNINNISYSIDPLIVPKDGPPAVGLAFNLRY